MTATNEVSLLKAPLARIATGWRIRATSILGWPWSVEQKTGVGYGESFLCRTDEAAKAEYMRLTQVRP